MNENMNLENFDRSDEGKLFLQFEIQVEKPPTPFYMGIKNETVYLLLPDGNKIEVVVNVTRTTTERFNTFLLD